MSRPVAERIFEGFLVFFPPGFRQRFGADMRDLFADQRPAAGRQG